MEVLRRYSNLRDQGERVQVVREMTPAGPKGAKVRTSRQAQRRLSPAKVGELVTQYQAGAQIKELATHFDVNRDTVFSILNRRQVVRRQRGIPLECVAVVVEADETGSSLAFIGAKQSVDPGTVARTLRKAGVPLRPRQGWDYNT